TDGRYPRHHRQIHIDDSGSLTVRTGTIRVWAEQSRFDTVRLGERFSDRIQGTRIRRGVAAARTTNRRLVDNRDTLIARHRTVYQRALAGTRHTGDRAQHPERDVDVHVAEIMGRRTTDLERAHGFARGIFELRPVL